MCKKAVIFGAGKIGRGFLAQLVSQSGYEIVFVDVDSRIIATLNQRKSYTIRLVGENSRAVEIRNFRAIHSTDIDAVALEIAASDVVFTAVGVAGLESAARTIAKGLEKRASLKGDSVVNIILCENLLDAPERLKGYVKVNVLPDYSDYVEKSVGFVPAIVSRMVPDAPSMYRDTDPLLIVTEQYDKLPVDAGSLVGGIPEIEGLIPVDNFEAYIERKLFIHNAGHSLASYLGYQAGYTCIYEAMRDKHIREIVVGALAEASEALIKRHRFDLGEMDDYIGDILKRFDNEALEDSAARGARSPMRKLSFNDRLIGAARLALEYGIRPTNLLVGIAAALRYNYGDDPEAVRLQDMLRTEGIDAVLRKVCGLSPSDALCTLIKERMNIAGEKGYVNQ